MEISLILVTFSIHTRGLVDLRPLAHHFKFAGNGLAGIAQSVLGVEMNKDHKVMYSAHETLNLNDDRFDVLSGTATNYPPLKLSMPQ